MEDHGLFEKSSYKLINRNNLGQREQVDNMSHKCGNDHQKILPYDSLQFHKESYLKNYEKAQA